MALAFFRMELGPDDVLSRHNGSEWHTMCRGTRDVISVADEMVAMGEIEMAGFGNSGKNGKGPGKADLVKSHVRYSLIYAARLQLRDLSPDQP